MAALVRPRPADVALPDGEARASRPAPDFEATYEAHFEFVWRSLRHLGVHEASVDDALQDVFVVVHRRLAEFDGRASIRSWLFAIALNVARDHRRARRRKGAAEPLSESLADAAPGPHDALLRSEAMRTLDAVLDELDDDRRAVFVLVEYEQMTAPEAAAALGANVNTVYSRLRAARHDFDAALARRRARLR